MPVSDPRYREHSFKNVRGWLRTAAILCSPAHANVTLTNLAFWMRTYFNASARENLRELFNEDYYLSTYSDVKQARVHPYLHALFRGFQENRNLSEHLETAHYHALYPDVKKAGINPVLHYALYGRKERRSAKPPCKHSFVYGEGESPQHDGDAVHIDNAWPGAPLVSVVITCFNYGSYIEEALKSVLSQTFQNFEVIVVEGGSTDGVSPQIVARLEQQAAGKIRVLYRSERHLAGDNRNYGISQARGRYICCLDADDRLHPVYLEAAVFLAEAYAFDIVSSSVQCFGGSSIVWRLEEPKFPAILEANQIATTALFRKSAWAKAGGYRDWGVGNDHIPEDWDFWIRMLAQGLRAKTISAPLMEYRVHSTGLTATAGIALEQQRQLIREANEELLRTPLTSQPDSIRIANRWTNLIQPEPQASPGFLIDLSLPRRRLDGLLSKIHGFRPIIITNSLDPSDYAAITPNVYPLPHLLDAPERESFIHYLLRRYNVRSIAADSSSLLATYLPRIRQQFPAIAVVDHAG